MEVDVYFLNHSPYYDCLSHVACAQLDYNKIFIDWNEIHQRDDCGRDPLHHEILHFIYPNIDIHNECLTAKLVHWKNTA